MPRSTEKVTVTLPYDTWRRILQHLDAPVTGGEGQTLGHALRKQILDEVTQ